MGQRCGCFAGLAKQDEKLQLMQQQIAKLEQTIVVLQDRKIRRRSEQEEYTLAALNTSASSAGATTAEVAKWQLTDFVKYSTMMDKGLPSPGVAHLLPAAPAPLEPSPSSTPSQISSPSKRSIFRRIWSHLKPSKSRSPSPKRKRLPATQLPRKSPGVPPQGGSDAYVHAPRRPEKSPSLVPGPEMPVKSPSLLLMEAKDKERALERSASQVSEDRQRDRASTLSDVSKRSQMTQMSLDVLNGSLHKWVRRGNGMPDKELDKMFLNRLGSRSRERSREPREMTPMAARTEGRAMSRGRSARDASRDRSASRSRKEAK